jgi:hypothetical protein
MTVHPAAVRGLIKTLRRLDPNMSIAVAGNLAGDIIRGAAQNGVSIIPTVLLDQPQPPRPMDIFDRIYEEIEAMEKAGRTPWNSPETQTWQTRSSSTD